MRTSPTLDLEIKCGRTHAASGRDIPAGTPGRSTVHSAWAAVSLMLGGTKRSLTPVRVLWGRPPSERTQPEGPRNALVRRCASVSAPSQGRNFQTGGTPRCS